MSNLPTLGGAAQGLSSLLSSKTRVQFILNNQTVVTLDCSLNEKHNRRSAPTRHPVENGATVSDHIIVDPFSLSITGIISDNPIGGLGGLLTEAATSLAASLLPPAGLTAITGAMGLASVLSTSSKPSVAAYLQLLQLQENGLPFDVLTTLYRYPSMVIADLSVPRDAGSGNILLFDVKLEQMILVTPQAVNVQIFANGNLSANNADLGSQGAGIPNGFAAGYKDTTSAINAIVPGGVAK